MPFATAKSEQYLASEVGTKHFNDAFEVPMVGNYVKPEEILSDVDLSEMSDGGMIKAVLPRNVIHGANSDDEYTRASLARKWIESYCGPYTPMQWLRLPMDYVLTIQSSTIMRQLSLDRRQEYRQQHVPIIQPSGLEADKWLNPYNYVEGDFHKLTWLLVQGNQGTEPQVYRRNVIPVTFTDNRAQTGTIITYEITFNFEAGVVLSYEQVLAAQNEAYTTIDCYAGSSGIPLRFTSRLHNLSWSHGQATTQMLRWDHTVRIVVNTDDTLANNVSWHQLMVTDFDASVAQVAIPAKNYPVMFIGVNLAPYVPETEAVRMQLSDVRSTIDFSPTWYANQIIRAPMKDYTDHQTIACYLLDVAKSYQEGLDQFGTYTNDFMAYMATRWPRYGDSIPSPDSLASIIFIFATRLRQPLQLVWNKMLHVRGYCCDSVIGAIQFYLEKDPLFGFKFQNSTNEMKKELAMQFGQLCTDPEFVLTIHNSIDDKSPGSWTVMTRFNIMLQMISQLDYTSMGNDPFSNALIADAFNDQCFSNYICQIPKPPRS